VIVLLVTVGMGDCYGIYCDSNWRWRTEAMLAIYIPNSARQFKNSGFGCKGSMYDGVFRTEFIMDRCDLRPFISQFEREDLVDPVPGDSVWYFGKTDATKWFPQDSWPQDVWPISGPPSGIEFEPNEGGGMVVLCQSLSADKVKILVDRSWH
jgi:hypothetical protein